MGMKLHVVGGIPRTGSTLFCNILNQNPKFFASDTSNIPRTLGAISVTWSQSSELMSDLINDRTATETQMGDSLRGFVEGWYKRHGDKTVFDKGRFWNHHSLMLRRFFPESHMFLCVRDLRQVIASTEKEHRKNPMLNMTQGGSAPFTAVDRINHVIEPIEHDIVGIEDALRQRKLNEIAGEKPRIHVVQYESFISDPKKTIDMVYSVTGERPYAHDFDEVVNVAKDVDALYGYKYPHSGSGKIEPCEYDWREYLPQDIADSLMSKFSVYNEALGYH
jgi:sulfotransferase